MDYNNLEDLLDAVRQEYGEVVEFLDLTIDGEDERFKDNQEPEEQETLDEFIQEQAEKPAAEARKGLFKRVKGFFRL